jgi:hypothetical protein
MALTTSGIETIPTHGFSWYVLILEDRWDDPIKEELGSNFHTLGQAIGAYAIAVRGFDSELFFQSVYETLTSYQPEWKDKLVRPSLLVCDTSPRLLLTHKKKLQKQRLVAANVILIPLAAFRGKPRGALSDFLRDLAAALQSPDAIAALSRLEPAVLSRYWGWLRKYVEVKPSFLGFGLDVGKMLDQVLQR